eukprot:9227104-Pyramimonas_sp.AAC.1
MHPRARRRRGAPTQPQASSAWWRHRPGRGRGPTCAAQSPGRRVTRVTSRSRLPPCGAERYSSTGVSVAAALDTARSSPRAVRSRPTRWTGVFWRAIPWTW